MTVHSTENNGAANQLYERTNLFYKKPQGIPLNNAFRPQIKPFREDTNTGKRAFNGVHILPATRDAHPKSGSQISTKKELQGIAKEILRSHSNNSGNQCQIVEAARKTPPQRPPPPIPPKSPQTGKNKAAVNASTPSKELHRNFREPLPPQRPPPPIPNKSPKIGRIKNPAKANSTLAHILKEIETTEATYARVLQLGCTNYPEVVKYVEDPPAKKALNEFVDALGRSKETLLEFADDLAEISRADKCQLDSITMNDKSWIDQKAISIAKLYRDSKRCKYFESMSKLNLLQKDLVKFQSFYKAAAKKAYEEGKLTEGFNMENDHNPTTLSTQRIMRHPLLLNTAMSHATGTAAAELEKSKNMLTKLVEKIDENCCAAQFMEWKTQLDSNEVTEAKKIIEIGKPGTKEFLGALQKLKMLEVQFQNYSDSISKIPEFAAILESPHLKSNIKLLRTNIALGNQRQKVSCSQII
jgi:hypothetical protein